jgi:hypothetical protein
VLGGAEWFKDPNLQDSNYCSVTVQKISQLTATCKDSIKQDY